MALIPMFCGRLIMMIVWMNVRTKQWEMLFGGQKEEEKVGVEVCRIIFPTFVAPARLRKVRVICSTNAKARPHISTAPRHNTTWRSLRVKGGQKDATVTVN
jgi:hypothetical protein